MPIAANPLQPLIDVFNWILVFFHDEAGLSWGTSIIALTVVVRVLLLPLAIRQFHSMQGLQQLAPEMKKLQEKYKEDRQRLNQEMMKLYQEHKVNPFGSCLPLLLQMPVFIALFYLLKAGGDARDDICGQTEKPCDEVIPGSADWFFIPDITDTATGGVLVTLILLYILSQLLSSVLMSVSADRNQRLLIIALPFVFVPFIISFPAGLLLYWITTNLWTVVQQTVIRKRAGMPVGFRSQPATGPVMSTQETKPARGRGDDKDAGDGAAQPGKDGDEGPARPRRQAAPPPPPRRKKKQRSGRRR